MRSKLLQIWYEEEAPLHLAAYCGHNDVIGILADCGVDIDSFNVYRDTWDRVTPLHFAVYKNKVATVRYLLELGADTSLYGKWGKAEGTPLHFAKYKKHSKLVDIIEEHIDEKGGWDTEEETTEGNM